MVIGVLNKYVGPNYYRFSITVKDKEGEVYPLEETYYLYEEEQVNVCKKELRDTVKEKPELEALSDVRFIKW